MGISAKEAAESVGITKHGILKAIREGRLSATKNKKGQWEIESSELYRVYDPVSPINSVNSEQVTRSKSRNTPGVDPCLPHENNELELKLEAAKDKIAWLEDQLEKANNRENKLIELATSQTKQLEDMREKSPSSQKPTEKRIRFFFR